LLENGLLEAYATLLDQEAIYEFEGLLEEIAFSMSNIATERPVVLIKSDVFSILFNEIHNFGYGQVTLNIYFTIGNAITCMEPQDLLEIEYSS
jgi:hypothetical protein